MATFRMFNVKFLPFTFSVVFRQIWINLSMSCVYWRESERERKRALKSERGREGERER